jgi:DNA excision repair protein ERCC-2
VVVADLNYAFDPDVHLRACFGFGAARRFVVVVDEAHQLPDRARGWASAQLDATLLDQIERRYAGSSGAPFRELADVVRSWILAEADSGEARPWEPDEGQLADALAQFDALAFEHARAVEADPRPGEDPWRLLGQALFRLATYADRAGEEVVTLTDGASIQLICRDAAFLLEERVAACAALIGVSATLHPTWFWRERIGVPDSRFVELAVEADLPAENRLVLVARGVSTAWKDRERERPRLIELIERCVAAVPGNVALFFGSFDAMNDVLDGLDLPGRERVVQRPGMSAEARAEAAAAMGEPRRVLAAVLGGVFGESVDLPPGALAAALIIGPSFPPPTLETQLLTEWNERRWDDGFGLASVQPGMTRVVQAAGRVIRRPEDRGAVVLVCRRFLQNELQAYLPEAWAPTPTSRPWEELAEFFGGTTTPDSPPPR